MKKEVARLNEQMLSMARETKTLKANLKSTQIKHSSKRQCTRGTGNVSTSSSPYVTPFTVPAIQRRGGLQLSLSESSFSFGEVSQKETCSQVGPLLAAVAAQGYENVFGASVGGDPEKGKTDSRRSSVNEHRVA